MKSLRGWLQVDLQSISGAGPPSLVPQGCTVIILLLAPASRARGMENKTWFCVGIISFIICKSRSLTEYYELPIQYVQLYGSTK